MKILIRTVKQYTKTMPLLFLSMAFLAVDVSAQAYRNIEWLELQPEDERGQFSQTTVDHSGGAYNPQVLPPQSARTVSALDGLKIKIPGFIVPVEFNEESQLTEFFLVPYFGACIHVPPPPPNQIVYGRMKLPVDTTSIYDAYLITGTLNVEDINHPVANSAYTMEVEQVELYEL